jgi:prepilin-type N-terminal cleavage/methylation domain-containing protein
MNTKPDKGVPVMKRKRGFSLTEILIVLAVSSIVLAIVAVVSSMTFKTSSQLNATMTLDEEITKLHTNMRYIISQSWTTMTVVIENEDGSSYVSIKDTVPSLLDEPLITEESTISYLPNEKRLVHYFKGKGGETVEQTISKYIDDFTFFKPNLESNVFIGYSATFTYYDANSRPVTEKFTSGAVRFY